MGEKISRKRYRVLLAEDDEISQQIVCVFLQESGDIDLKVVADGRAALSATLTEQFDLLILDQNLPEISGDRIVRHLRAGISRNKTTPILRFSASITAPGQRVTGLGHETLLPKPLEGELFVRTVRALLTGGAVDSTAELAV